MPQSASTGLAVIVAKTLRSCLTGSPKLPYNWDDKLQGLVVNICVARSLVLQNIAQKMPANVKTTENKLSAFLSRKRLNMSKAQYACVTNALRRVGKRRLWKHEGKAAIIVDSTSYAKKRSRGKKRPMPKKGKVRLHNLPTTEKVLVPGYQEITTSILLKDGTVLPITRRLWSENGPDCASQNLAEEAEILKAQALVREVFKLEAILVADSGFRRKDLLLWLKNEGMDFVIRLEGRLTVALRGKSGLLEDVAPWWPARVRMPWRDGAKHLLVSDVSARRVSVVTSSEERFCFNALCLMPTKEQIEPMFLATTLRTSTVPDLMLVVRLYARRWGIETFFWKFKQGMNAQSWRVYSSWEAIDRLLIAAHMAYLVLVLLAQLVAHGRTKTWRKLRRRLIGVLRTRFARPPELTQGRFFKLVAMDFPSPCWAGAAA